MSIMERVRQAITRDEMDETHKNSDGSFMSPEQIFEDIVANSRIGAPGLELLQHNFDPPLSDKARETMRRTGINGPAYMRMKLGEWIRNSYGLWAPENPHTKDPDDKSEVRDGIDFHPKHPDTVAETVIVRLVEHFQPTRH